MAPSPMPAAPAMPSMVRARVQRPGSSVTGARPTTRMMAQHDGLDRPVEEAGGQREEEHGNGFEQAQLDRARARSKGTSVRSWSPCSSAAESMPSPERLEEPKYTGRRRGRPRASGAPDAAARRRRSPPRPPSARYMPR